MYPGKKSYLAAAFFFMLFTTFSYSQSILTIGEKAPAIKVSKWVKGTPVKSISKEKIYVVEFWATWCGPCRQSIPHLTEMAHKFKGKVNFIGVDVWESEGQDINKLVTDFVKEMGDKMDYNVAMDTGDKFMALNWMEAAAQRGIPAAFIVGKDSKIAWIGHPMEIDEPLTKIVEGNYDGKEYAAKLLKEQKEAAVTIALNKKFKEKGKEITTAAKAKDYKKVIEECEKLLAADPSLKSVIDGYYIKALVKVNPAKAIELADKTAAVSEEDLLRNFLFPFTDKDNDKKLYDYAINACTKMLVKNANDLNTLYVLANAYELNGDKAKTIETLEKFLSAAREQKVDEKNLESYVEKVKKLKESK